MIKLTAAALAASLVVPATADACLHEIRVTTEDYVRVVARAERLLERGSYGDAMRAIGNRSFPTPALRERAKNVRAILALRMRDRKQKPGALVAHFKAATETKATQKDVRYRAWLAEALVEAGNAEEARPILMDLHTRDLMPDAYGYVALAKLSSGTERYDYYNACRTRAANKNICELPAKSVQARR